MMNWLNASGYHFDLILVPAILVVGVVWFVAAQARYRRTSRRAR